MTLRKIAASLLAFAFTTQVVPSDTGVARPVIEGVLYDATGQPLSGCRVVARAAEGTDVFISEPSAADGRYTLPVSPGRSYGIVAIVSATGARIPLPTPPAVAVLGGNVEQDLRMPVPLVGKSRRGENRPGGSDRLFLSFIEDPAIVARQRYEVLFSRAEFDVGQRTEVELQASFAPLESVELGLRGGRAEIDPDAGGRESGTLDLELWAKLHLFQSADTRTELAAGAVMTFPTGDDAAGIGRDALQSKLFLALSYALPAAVLVAHVGLRTTEDGRSGGVALDGQVSAAAGIGVVIPFSDRWSAVVEAFYDGERFDGVEADSRVLGGVNWHVGSRGRIRAAVAAGLEETSPDTELQVGYVYGF